MAIDSIETIPIPNPPTQLKVENMEEINTALNNIYQYTQDNTGFQDQLYNILHSGNLVRNFRVENLSASKIIAGTIAVDSIFLGDSTFELDGLLKRIIVK